MLRQWLPRTVFVLLILIVPIIEAQKMPSITVSNKSDAMVEIVPADQAHVAQIPAPLDHAVAQLPPGAFILKNHTANPINVIVVIWTYVDQSGKPEKRRMNFNGYFGLPTTPLVKSNDSAVVTPDGCTMREHFAHLVSGGPMLGGNLLISEVNKALSDAKATFVTTEISIDSVIFADGTIWGPDKLHYYRDVSERYWAGKSVAEEVMAAKSSGQDVGACLTRILTSEAGKGEKRAYYRHYFAGLLQRSPGSLKLLIEQPPLPDFHHVEGDHQ